MVLLLFEKICINDDIIPQIEAKMQMIFDVMLHNLCFLINKIEVKAANKYKIIVILNNVPKE
jgi:hypothetical protein